MSLFCNCIVCSILRTKSHFSQLMWVLSSGCLLTGWAAFLIAVSQLFDALPPIDCKTSEQSLKALTGHILQRFKGSPVHILKLMRGREVAARSSIQHFKWGETIQLSLTLGGKLTVFSWHNKYKTLQIKENSSTFKSKAMENFTKNTKKLSFRLRRKLLTVGQINVKTLQTKETYPSFRSNTLKIIQQSHFKWAETILLSLSMGGYYYRIELKNVRHGRPHFR